MLSTLLYTAALLQAPATNVGYYMQPSLRGDEVVFVSQGDLWEVGTGGGQAHALTSHVAPASRPAISPDGKTVAFTGTYEGPGEAYVMSIEGDVPKRLTYEGGMNVAGWTPDGKVLIATRNRSTLPNYQLLELEPATRKQSLVPLAQAADGSYDAAGKTLYFTRFNFQGSYTKRYQGGTAQNVWKYTEGSPEAVPLTKDYNGTSKTPMWWNGRVYFLTDRDGTMNLWSMDENGRDLKQITKHEGFDIQSASVDGGKAVYQLGADLWLCDLKSGVTHPIAVTLASDFDQTRERWIKDPMSYLTNWDVSPDGSKFVLTARGQVFVAPLESGRLVEVTRKAGVRYRNAMFAPDGKSVFVMSDETGETEWWRVPANGVGKPEQITSGTSVLGTSGAVSPDGKLLAFGDKNQDLWLYDAVLKKRTKIDSSPWAGFDDLHWSPDSKWLAYQQPSETFGRIVIYSVATGKSVPVTSDRFDAYSPAWSPDGKWLYFISDRTFRSLVGSPWGPRAPEPFFDKQGKIYQLALVKGLRSPFQPSDELFTPPDKKGDSAPVKVDIDFDGIIGRQSEVPVGVGNYGNLRVNADRLFVRNSQASGGSDLVAIDIKNTDVSAKTVVPGIASFDLTLDGKKLALSKGGRFYVIPASSGPGTPLEKMVDLSSWSFAMDPREEWRQMFVEAWRLERDYFYDPKLHSVDWNGILKRYMPLVDRVRDRAELANLVSQMVGELSALHTFVYGGDLRRPQDNVAPASLGALLSRDESAGGYRIDRIYEADPDYPTTLSPLAQPNVDAKVGDVITAINGTSTLLAADISALLRNQAGKQVLLSLKHDTSTRDVIAVPIDPGAFSDLRYTDWELKNRQKVDELGKGQIGYLHLRAMSSGDIATFERDFYPVFNRQGLIIDVRHNGGGNIDSWILEKLMRKAWFYWQPRVGNPYWNMQWAFRGHVVVLCDENTGSDGEAFTEGIKRLGIGKVIGTRTWGGEIWLTSSNVLADTGIATAAEFGVYGPEGQWLIEGHGVDPDVVVDNLPHATFLGSDAQLQAGVDYLAKMIKQKPVPVPKAPPYPSKAWPRKSGGG